MDHSQAVKTGAVEKYLLKEFSPAEAEEFTEHFFDCMECAEDLRLTSLFIDTSKAVLKNGLGPAPRTSEKWWRMEWLPAQYAMAAALVCLAFILYQNAVVFPGLRMASAPQTLAYISLSNLGARSGGTSGTVAPQGKPFLLLIDVPMRQDLSGYRCDIETRNGNKVLSVAVPETLAQKPAPILIPASTLPAGSYIVIISGHPKDGSSADVEVDKASFQIM